MGQCRADQRYLEMEVQYDDHLPVTRLEDGVLDVVIKNVHFISADRRETEACPRRSRKTFNKKVKWTNLSYS